MMERERWWLIAALVAALGMWCFFDYIVIPAQEQDAAVHHRLRGNGSDLYPSWIAARELLRHGLDPYSTEVTAEIQKGMWGRPIHPGLPGEPTDESRFAYPVYLLFLLAPTVYWNFELVQRLYMFVTAVLTVLSVWWWCRFFNIQCGILPKLAGSALILGSYSGVIAVRVQQPVLVVAALLAGGMAAISADFLVVAGILLALVTLKPQVTLAVITWLLFWSLSHWPERKKLFISFTGTMVGLLLVSEWWLPGWMGEWLTGLSAYKRYVSLHPSQVKILFGHYVGSIVGVVLMLGMVVLCWRARHDAASTARFKLLPAVLLAATLVVSPVWHIYDQIFFLPAAVLLVWHWRDRFHRLTRFEGRIVMLAVAALFWQWMAAAVVCLVALWSPVAGHTLEILPWLSVLLIPTPILISLILLAKPPAQAISATRTKELRDIVYTAATKQN